MAELRCPCGQPLHYSSPVIRRQIEALVDKLGEYTEVTTPDGTWRVSRHFIALHGLRAADLPSLGFEKVA